MAEFIAREKFGGIIQPSSAGFRPQGPRDAENAIYTLKTLFNINASRHQPRDIHEIDVSSYDLVVVMDGWVAKQFKTHFPAYPPERLVKWKIDDPYGDNLDDYWRCAQAIFKELKKLPVLSDCC